MPPPYPSYYQYLCPHETFQTIQHSHRSHTRAAARVQHLLYRAALQEHRPTDHRTRDPVAARCRPRRDSQPRQEVSRARLPAAIPRQAAVAVALNPWRHAVHRGGRRQRRHFGNQEGTARAGHELLRHNGERDRLRRASDHRPDVSARHRRPRQPLPPVTVAQRDSDRHGGDHQRGR